MYKKIIALILASALTLSFVGCSSDSEAETTTEETTTETTETTEIAYPEKPIELIVPWNAGGVADLAARIIATVATTNLEQPVAVVNQAGAAGTLAATQYLQEDPDGYKLLLLSTPVITMQPHARDVAYTWDDFEPVIGLQQMEQFLITSTSNEDIDTIEELAETAKTRTISFGTNGPGAPDHIYATALMQHLGVEFSIVVYDDAVSIQNAILGGHIDLGVGNMGNFEEHVKSGDLAILGTFSESDIELADIGVIKSLSSQGIEVAGSLTYFIVARAGTPEEVINKIYETFNTSLSDATFVEFLETRGLTVTNRNPEELGAYIEEEIVKVNAYFE